MSDNPPGEVRDDCGETDAKVRVEVKCVWESRSTLPPKANTWLTHEVVGEGPAQERYEYLTQHRKPSVNTEIRNVRLLRRVVEDTGWKCRRHVLGVVRASGEEDA